MQLTRIRLNYCFLISLITHIPLIFSRNNCAHHYHNSRRDGPHITCICNEKYCDDIAPIGDIGDKEAIIYHSSKSGLRMEQSRVSFCSTTQKWRTQLTVSPKERRQEIIGFGGAFTDSAVINMDNLPELSRWKLLESYFGENGIQYSLGRVPIGSNDFSTRPYSYNEWMNDYKLVNFSLADEDYSHKIPAIHHALNLTKGDLRFVATPWTAPYWMKTNQRNQGAGALIREKDKVDIWKVYVLYILKFFESYAQQGIEFFGLTVQNEPNISTSPHYPWQAMYFSPRMEMEFVKKYLGPAMGSSNITNGIDIIIMDQSRDQLEAYTKVLEDSRAFQYTAGFGIHWYADGKIEASIMKNVAETYPNKYLLYTEAANGWLTNDVLLGDWDRAEKYIQSIIMALRNRVGGWIDYNLCVDKKGGPSWIGNNLDASIIVDKENRSFMKQPMFYAIGHFSKFIRPGAVYIESNLSSDAASQNLLYSSFLNTDGSRVSVIYNLHATMAANITVIDMGRPFDYLNVDIEPQSIATVIWKPNIAPVMTQRSVQDPQQATTDQTAVENSTGVPSRETKLQASPPDTTVLLSNSTNSTTVAEALVADKHSENYAPHFTYILLSISILLL